MNGCTNPSATNYNPAATQDDGSCVYLEKQNGICYAFQDVEADQIVDESFTLSLSLRSKSWVFFHDYTPDFYFSDRSHLYSLKDSKIYRHHEGAPGVYYNSTPQSFFIDAIFPGEEEAILNSVSWITQVMGVDGAEKEFSTLTHITVWNSQQCSGRIAVTQLLSNLAYEGRKTKGQWNLEDFRDMVATYGTAFLLDLFHNFAVDESALNTQKPWFDTDLLHDNWFCVRFEFDNTSADQCILHGVDIDASKSYR